ncbi:MAG: hypothetical protein K0S76_2696, partial [Herbinix sp.]|nr:hypothetical protein [Herbinix sp.]
SYENGHTYPYGISTKNPRRKTEWGFANKYLTQTPCQETLILGYLNVIMSNDNNEY